MSAFIFFLWILHLSDLFSDLLYLVTTPFYSAWIFAFSIIFFVLPIIMAIVVACSNKNFSAFFTIYFDLTQTNELDRPKSADEFKALTKFLLFVLLEDAPQVFIQSLNTMLIG